MMVLLSKQRVVKLSPKGYVQTDGRHFHRWYTIRDNKIRIERCLRDMEFKSKTRYTGWLYSLKLRDIPLDNFPVYQVSTTYVQCSVSALYLQGRYNE